MSVARNPASRDLRLTRPITRLPHASIAREPERDGLWLDPGD
jgi:hypothetical protein